MTSSQYAGFTQLLSLLFGICTAHKGRCQINRNDNRRTPPPRMALPSWKGRFTPADSLVKDLAAPEIVKAEEHREGEGPLENVFEFVINMNTRAA